MTPNILLTRIDNRLVHGQVGVTWTTAIGANLLVVVDDIAANDKIQQQLMTMTAESSGVGIRFFSIEKTIKVIGKAAPSQKIFLVCKTPETVRKLVDGGVPLKEVNVGNMHFSDGKRQLTKKVFVDDKDVEDLKYIESKGLDVYIQDTPGDLKSRV
ncbi:PTS galactosamine transporter subunit IIB [Clostridium hydrogeniformans]|uniref:PTS galactosamine transporter subunit IIB n=1 Tax=Clostridium hydrogeniformans TaxID=349933 RepID=UPI000489DA67|nr:PTS galactosamine transporter subunit IIB [Clostridium hydrogeniformans]